MAKDFLKRVVIKEELVELTGNFALAVTLDQLLYWAKRVKDSNNLVTEELARISTNKVTNMQAADLKYGWIYKSSEELSQEIMIGSPSTVRRYLIELVKKKYIFTRRNPNPKYKYDKTYHYRVNLVKIIEDLKKQGYKLDHFDIFYKQEVGINQNESSNNQNEKSIGTIESSDLQNTGAIPKSTTDNIYTELEEEDAKSALANVNDLHNPLANQLANYYLMKSSKARLAKSDISSIRQVVQLDLPLQILTQLIDDCFTQFIPQHERDKIRSFAYVANYIFDKQHHFKMNLNQKQDKMQEEKSNGKNKQSITTNSKGSSEEAWFNRAKEIGIV